MKKESKNYSLWQRFGAMVLAAVLVLGMVPATGVSAAGNIGTVHKIEDPETLTRPQAIYGDNTLNAGKITVGKSVSKDAITVDGHQIGLIDDNNFLVTISQTAQVMGLSSETKIPVDVVFVLDTSGSMEDNERAESLVTAANSAIKTLMETNDQNRVAVVTFSSAAQMWNNQWSDWGGGTAGGAAANVLSSLAHYTGDAATNHLRWVNSQGAASGDEQVYIAGRDPATITVYEWQWTGRGWENVPVQKDVTAFRHGKSGGTNIQAGITMGAEILTKVQNTTWTDPETNETVTRIPFLIVISDGQPTYVSDSETWYDFSGNGQKGPGSGAYEGNGFITAVTAAYYKGKITEHYYGSKASADNHCFVYTMGVELEALDDTTGPGNKVNSVVGDEQSLSQITLDPVTYASGSYAADNAQSYYRYGNTWDEQEAKNRNTTHSFMTYWSNFVAGNDFDVRVNSNETFKFTATSIAAAKKYVNGIGYTGGMLYNDEYFAVDDVEQMENIFKALIATIQEKSITVPTKVTTGDHDFDGYVTFADPLGEYMEIKSMKGIMINGQFYQGATAAQYMASGANAEFNAMLEKVLKTRLIMTGSTATGANLLNGAKASPYQAYYNSATDFDNSIVWWGKGYRVEGEEDPGMQVLASAYNDSIEYITDPNTSIPEGATHVCRSYFFGAPGQGQTLEYLYFVVRVQRSLKAPYQQTVVISAPASLLSVEKVMIEETYDNNNNSVYTASVQEAAPARVVYEVGLWDTINEETVSTIVSETYRNEAVNGESQANYDPDADTYYFFTNDWDRTEDQDHHHRAMAKATFDAAADNAFYTYQENTLLVNANGNPVTSNPRGTKVYYVREYYDWSGSRLNNGTYAATKKTKLIEVEVPSDAELIQENGKWYIPKGAYTAATLIVNGDDAEKSSNETNTSEIVAHPHRTGDAGNSHYTVLLGNNGSISLKSNVPAPTKTVSNVTTNIVNADGKSVMVGDELVYTIHGKNYSSNTGKVTITDTVPAGTVFVYADNGITPDANGKLTWVLENVAAGAEVSVSFKVKVTEAALDNEVVTSAITNTATVQLNNSPAYDTNTVTNPPQGKKVVIQGDTTGTSVQVGDILQYFIEFHNDTGAVADQVTIVDRLPAGTDFVVADHNGVYDSNTHTVTWAFNNVAAGLGGVVSFSVQVNPSAKTTIENDANIEIGDHEYETNTTTTNLDQGSLTLKKTVVIPAGLTPAEDTFTLTLTDPSGKLNDTYSGVTFTNGVATVEIKHNQTITIEGLAAGTTILVSEAVPAGFQVSYTNNGQAVIPVNGTASVEVTNTYAVSKLEVTLEGQKTLQGSAPDNETFGFTVVPCDADGKANGAAIATGEVTLNKDTKAITFGKLTFSAPGTYHYLVSEVNGGQTGVTYTQVQYLVTIQVTDKGDGTLGHTMSVKTRSGSTGAFGDYTGTTMLFANEYKPLSTSITLEGHKTLNGRDLKAGEFSFVVTENGNVVSTGSNNADGKISFRPITYSETGTHTYVISEQAGNLSGVTYSDKTFTVTVEVVDVDGQLVATAKDASGQIINPTKFGETFTFVNTFKPKEVAVTLEANKVLAGATLKDSQFSFVVNQKDDNGNLIKDSDGNPVIIASGSNDAAGKIIFSKIEYFLDSLGGANSKIFRYQITELVPDSGVDPSLYYDGLVIDVSVTVTYDPSTGTLSVGDPVYSADTTFNNIDNPDTVTVIPVGQKIVDVDMPTTARFSFSVYAVDESVPNKRGKLVASGVSGEPNNQHIAAVTFTGITYDYDDLAGATSKIFRYWIVEDRAGDVHAGIHYDKSCYLLEVTLSVVNNELIATPVYKAIRDKYAGETEVDPLVLSNYMKVVSNDVLTFSNTYSVTTGTSVTMEVTKVLSNRALKAGEFEFGLYHIDNGMETLVATATNDATGKVTFTRLYLPSVMPENQTERVIDYVIRELDNKVHGVNYENALAKPVYVKVTVGTVDGALKVTGKQYSYSRDNGFGTTVLSFENTYTPDPAEVILTGTKELTGPDGNRVALTGGEFSFKVLAGNEEVAWGSNAANGSITFSKIVYTYQQFLAADTDQDGAATFTYTIQEVIPDIGADSNLKYDTDTFQVTVTVSYDRSTGALTASASYDKTVAFYNNPATITVKPEGVKNIIDNTGLSLNPLRFSFRAKYMGMDQETLVNNGPVVATGVSQGAAFTGDEIDFTELVFDYDDAGHVFYYLLEEVRGTSNAVTYASKQYVMEVAISRNSTTDKLEATVHYYHVDENADITIRGNWHEAVSVAFENTFNSVLYRLDILGTKIMEGKTLHGGEFDFRLQLLNAEDKLASAIVDGVNGSTDQNGHATITFGTLVFTENQLNLAYEQPTIVPSSTLNYRYRVLLTEIEPATNAIPGVTYSNEMYIAVINWQVHTDAESHKTFEEPYVEAIYAAQQQGDTYVISGNNLLTGEATVQSALAFKNVYTVTAGTSATMKVQKLLENRVLQAGEFTFGLYHVHDDGIQREETLVLTATNAADGTVTFTRNYEPSVLTTHGGQITYVIRELSGNVDGVDYSQAQENPVYVTVTVADDNEGGLKLISVTYSDKNGNPIPVDEDTFPTFTNTYTPDPVEVALEADKVLTGPDGNPANLSGGEFSFEVLEGTTEVAWGSNDASGKIIFSDLVFDYEDMKNDAGEYVTSKTFTYTVKEVVPDVGVDPSLYYDPATYSVSITVRYDRVSGELTADAPVITKNGETVSTMSFNNVDNPDTIAVTPEGTKITNVISGTIPADTQFSFTIYALNDAGERGAVVGAGTSGINGPITFSTLVYNFEDVGKTFKYVIVEDNGGSTRAGITYDAASFEMTVAIRAVDNELFADVSYSESVAFENKYQVTEPTTVEIVANKNLTGRDLRFGEFGFNLYHIHNNAETLIAATINGYEENINKILFSRTYAPSILTGEHKQADGTAVIYYVIREQVNNLGGVDYSNAKPVYVKVTITAGTDGTMQAVPTYYTDATFTTETTDPAFTNSYETTDTVFKPEVDKVLNGRDMVDDEFSFVVKDLAGNPVSYGLSKAALSGNAGSILFNEITYTYQQFVANKNADGVAVFTYEISEIPGNLVNVNYTNVKIYLQVTVKDLGNGKLKAEGKYYSGYNNGVCENELTAPAFVNSYTPIGTTVVLNANKTLTGRAPVDGEFSFQVKDAQGNVVATGGNYDGNVIFSGIGITAAMMDGQLEKTFTFTMEELNTNQGAVKYDPNKYTAEVTVVNNLTTGMLEVTDVTYSTGNGAAPTFVNEYDPTPAEMALTIHKDLINHTLNAGMFRFEVTFEGQVVAQITNDAQGNAIFSGRYPVSVLDDVTPNADNVRSKTFVYTITEVTGTADSEDDNGTYTYDPARYTVTVIVTDDGKGNLSTERTITKDGERADYVVFTNSFTPDPIEVDLDTAFGATKTIVDDEGNVIQREDVVFSFVVTDLNGNTITTGTAKGEDAVDGVMPVDFGTFTFSVEGEYRYLITESTSTLDGYVLDTTIWCTHIQVNYDPDTGKLSVSESDVYTHILTPETHAEEDIQALGDENPAFVNIYDTDDVQLHLVMDKTMIGDRTHAKEHEFKFQLLSEDGIIMGEAWNHADGSIHFYLDYTLQDLLDQDSRIFRYTVKEIIPEAAELVDGSYVLNGITYDSSVYTLAVTLTDNGEGELVTTVDGTVVAGTVYTGIEFVNKYIAQDVTVPFHAIKRMEGMPLLDGIYTFYLMDGEEILSTGTNRADGTIVFNKTLTYTEPGTYTYTMVEYKDVQPGVTFDETSFTVTVVVTDNGRGNLEYTIAYTTEDGTYDLPVFINIYQPTGIVVGIKANKELTGRDQVAGEFTFQLLDADRAVVSEVTNAADGTVTFEPQRYTEVGTYTYTIEEVIPEGAVENADGTYTLNGVTYDKTVYTVVVDITDPGFDGQLDKQVTYYLGTEIVEEAKVIFTNTYKAADSDPVVIEGNKTLENQDLVEETFQFQLKDSEGNVLQTKSHDDNGLFAFDALVYTFADMDGLTEKVFTYTVSEVLGNRGGIIYDKTVYTVTVTVTDDGLGNLTAEAVVTGGKNDGKIQFTNVYTTNATSADVTAKKELTGKKLEDGEFQFVLVNQANKDERYQVSNKADGTIVFEDLTFAVAGTYVYDLYEVAGSDSHYSYDDQIIVVTITVVDNGDGTMTATTSYSKSAVFHNEYHPDPISVTLEGDKQLTGRDQVAGEFTFEVRDAEGKLVTTGTNAADGTIVFKDIVIDTETKLTLYVTEVQGNAAHVVYDDYTYRVVLNVVNDNGELKATVTYLDGDVIFFNEYKPPETPPTGDDTPIFLYVGLMAFSAVALVAVLILGRKKKGRKFC